MGGGPVHKRPPNECKSTRLKRVVDLIYSKQAITLIQGSYANFMMF